MKSFFSHCYYHKFKAPNASEIIDEVNNDNLRPVTYAWSDMCSVETFDLNTNKYARLLEPNINIFINEVVQQRIEISVTNLWMNAYSQYAHQEIHDHCDQDFVCVFIMNTGPNFGQLYFVDRDYAIITEGWKRVMNMGDRLIPSVEQGDIIFFPGHLLHGVSTHKSNTIRKTISGNFRFNVPL